MAIALGNLILPEDQWNNWTYKNLVANLRMPRFQFLQVSSNIV